MFSNFKKPRPQKRFSVRFKVAYYSVIINTVIVRSYTNRKTAEVLKQREHRQQKGNQKHPPQLTIRIPGLGEGFLDVPSLSHI